MGNNTPFEVYVKAASKTLSEGVQESPHGTLGACPFSFRVLLTLEEKMLPYKAHFVDSSNKPEWLTNVNSKGSVPILEGNNGTYVIDSDAICDYLEQITDFPRLGTVAETPKYGENIWEAFVSYLQGGSKDGFLKELEQIEAVVSDTKDKAWCGGADINSWDVALGPRLYLARVGCKRLMGWDFAAEQFPHLKSYLHRWVGRKSWRNAASWDDDSIEADLREEMVVKS